MDGVSQDLAQGCAVALDPSPPFAPLTMRAQDFSRCPPRRHARVPERAVPWRWLAFGGGIGLTVALAVWLGIWRSADGLTVTELTLIGLSSLTGFWISLSATTALCGALSRPHRPSGGPGAPMSVALLMPVYHEDMTVVTAAALAMLRDLAARTSHHRFSLHILSDTRGDGAHERAAIDVLRRLAPIETPVWYRQRPQNTDRKSGNVADWIRTSGGGYEAMIVLDADSLMGARTMVALADDMGRSPGTGLIQTAPTLIRATTLFARAQAFAGAAYGPLLGRGLACWSGDTANFWGHNAIIRTRAFASSAGLPHVRGKMIWSHDFVEAALLRRRGWAVRLRPDLNESYEETPPSLVDHILRDRRWCQGNLQHLRLLSMAGLTPVSRLHLLQGAAAFLVSPLWLALLIGWSVQGDLQGRAPGGWMILMAIYAVLLLPKAIGLTHVLAQPGLRRRFGGRATVIGSAALELAISVLIAPIMMVQQTFCILRVLGGRTIGWSPQDRRGGRYGFATLVKFHAIETLSGLALSAAILTGGLSAWLIPVALSLGLAAPISWMTAMTPGKSVLTTAADRPGTGVRRRVRQAEADIATHPAPALRPLAVAAE